MTVEPLTVTFDSLRDVKALHRMVMNRKFDGPDDIFFGSPQIAAAQNALVEALMTVEPHEASRWQSWRNARAHEHVLKRVRQHLSDRHDLVATMAPTDRRSYVESLLAPLVADPELMEELTTPPTSG
jgi:hypothetical protein